MRLFSKFKSRRFRYRLLLIFVPLLALMSYQIYQFPAHSNRISLIRKLGSNGYTVGENRPQYFPNAGANSTQGFLNGIASIITRYTHPDSYVLHAPNQLTSEQLTNDIDDFIALKRPYELDITSSKMTSLEPLKKMTNLHSLRLGGCSELTDMSSLKTCSNLQTLHISDCPNLNLQEQLPEVNSLVHLTITNSDTLLNTDCLSEMHHLERLTVRECDHFQNLSGLYDLKKLKTVMIRQKEPPTEEFEKFNQARPTVQLIHDPLN